MHNSRNSSVGGGYHHLSTDPCRGNFLAMCSKGGSCADGSVAENKFQKVHDCELERSQLRIVDMADKMN